MGCICDVIRLKNSAKVVPIRSGKPKPHFLTPDQIAVIRNNWNILKLSLSPVGVNTFICLFESRPELQETFEEFKGKELKELKLTGLLRKHSLRVMTTIDNCIMHLDDPSYMIPSLVELGKMHAKKGVPAEYVESILPPFLNTIKPYIEQHWCSDLEDAWETFFTWILYHIKDGMTKPK